MKLLGLLTAVVVAAATLTTAASVPSVGAAVRTKAVTAPEQVLQRATAEQLRGDRHAVVYFMQKTWSVQRRIPVPLTPTNHVERRWRSRAALHWLKHRWNVRWHHAKHRLRAHRRLPFTGDWQTAVRIVQRVWPGTSSWLLSCSSGEGGHGIWVWNEGAPYSSPNHGSGAGGWMQYMEGTFNGHIAVALADARARHLAVPPPQALSTKTYTERGWLSPLAQAFAAGYARFIHATSAWDPGIDPACA